MGINAVTAIYPSVVNAHTYGVRQDGRYVMEITSGSPQQYDVCVRFVSQVSQFRPCYVPRMLIDPPHYLPADSVYREQSNNNEQEAFQ